MGHANRRNLILLSQAAALALFSFLVFSQTLSFDFLHSDDDVNVFENEHIRELSRESLRWMFTDFQQAIRFKPLSWLGWALIHQVYALNPFGYHLANVLLHAANTAALFLLLNAFTRDNRLISAVATLAWSIHPLRVEPVAWITGFPYHLTTFFLLIALHAYVRIRADESVFRQGAYWIALAFYSLALAAYPLALGFVFALVALDLFQLNPAPGVPFDGHRFRARLLAKIPFFLGAAALTYITVASRYQVASPWGSAAQSQGYDLLRHLLQATYVWTYYLWKPFFPAHQTPIPMDLIENATFSPAFLFGMVAFIAISITILIRSIRRGQLGWAAFWLAHVGLLVPLLGLTEDHHFPSDRYAILNGIVLSFAAAEILGCLPKTRATGLAMTTGLLVLCMATLRYLPVWQDDTNYFGYLSLRLENNLMRPAILDRLGDAHLRLEEPDDAIAAYRNALSGDPRYVPPTTRLKLAATLNDTGRPDEAKFLLRTELETRPDAGRALFLLARIFADEGRLNEAVALLNESIRVEPTFNAARELLNRLKPANQ